MISSFIPKKLKIKCLSAKFIFEGFYQGFLFINIILAITSINGGLLYSTTIGDLLEELVISNNFLKFLKTSKIKVV